MTCTRYRELISRYVDGEVTPRQRTEVLAHVEICHDCAAWLARARQADVLLKGVPETRPSDKVRDAVLAASKSKQPPYKSAPPPRHIHLSTGADLRLHTSALLLRFDASPQRIALAMAAALLSIVGVAYWLNVLPPIWGYNQFGFLFPREQEPPASTSTPLPALSTTNKPAAPNVLNVSPAEGEQEVGPQTPLSIGFDLPMDRVSVQEAVRVEPPLAGAFQWKYDNELTFAPTGAGLLRGVTYTVRLSDTARSLAGARLEKPHTWAFHTHSTYSVTSSEAHNASIPITSNFTLLFDAPMDTAHTVSAVALRAEGALENRAVSYSWDEEGKTLTVSPHEPLPVGAVTLRVGADLPTRSGDMLGRAFEFTYRASSPSPSLRMVGERVIIAQTDRPALIKYALADDSMADNPVRLQVYDLPGEQLSALGAQARAWPVGLPADFPANLSRANSLAIRRIEPSDNPEVVPTDLSGQLPGMYLVAAASAGAASDWQLLIVADRRITLTGNDADAPFWLTDETGKPWADAEVSLYSPAGMLLEKGVSDASGLWSPTASGAAATLAVARDPHGRLAATLLDPKSRAAEDKGALAATLQTDQSAYYPGQAVNFRAVAASQAQPPVGLDSGVTVSLLNPNGSTLSVLNLKPDDVGGVTGLFNLAPAIALGQYALRVKVGAAWRDFPLEVLPPRNDGLSVYIASQVRQTGDTDSVTYTVSVLGQHGQPASAADVTATLRIPGDAWASPSVSAITDVNGDAALVMSLPAWLAYYKDPSIYLDVQASLKESVGRESAPLDLLAAQSLLYGRGNLASPSLDLAAITEPEPDGSTRLRLVTLGANEHPVNGYVLVRAEAPSGESQLWAIDLAGAGGNVTLPVPAMFAGGIVAFLRAGVGGYRQMALPASRNPDLQLLVNTTETVAAGASLPVSLNLLNKDGQGVVGTASIWFMRVSGDAQPDKSDWEPAAPIAASGTATSSVTAPNTPGLWYVMVEAASARGGNASSRAVVEVLPGPSMQLPPSQQLVSSVEQEVLITVYNPLDTPLRSGVRAEAEGSAVVMGNSSQGIDIAAHGRQSLRWRVFADRPGRATLAFSFLPSAEVGGVWALDLLAKDNPRTNKTYASGAISGERSVGALVPSGLSDNGVQLEIRASTSLLSTLTDASADLASQNNIGDAASWAAQLSAATSELDRSLALQALYAAQSEDGGWGSLTQTTDVLLAMRRQSLAWAELGGEPEPAIDGKVTNRALAYLSWEAARPVDERTAASALDEKARALYTLALYGEIKAEAIRSMMAYAGVGAKGAKLSAEGVAWLTLALWGVGNAGDALALIDSLLLSQPDTAEAASPPLLEALVAVSSVDWQMGEKGESVPDRFVYKSAARETANALMERRQGALWATPSASADALWALSFYADQEPEGASGTPSITLNDRAVPIEERTKQGGLTVVTVSGNALHAGTNWLRLQAPAGKPLYYSLTLRATR